MSPNPHRKRRVRGPRAYTLNEMLIVVALIGALVAVAYPTLQKPLAKHRLRAVAKQLRAELAAARLEAIQSGETFQFRYVSGTGRYQVEPLNPDQRSGGQSDSDPFADDFQSTVRTSQEQTDGLLETTSDGSDEDDRQELPQDIAFVPADEALDPLDDSTLETGSERDASNLLERSEGSDDLEMLALEDWSTPIVFYPNGRTSNAVIQLVGDRDYRIRLTLRGVTGAISVGKLEKPVEDLEEPPRAEPPARVASRPPRGTSRAPRSPSQSLFRGSIHGIPTNRAPAAR